MKTKNKPFSLKTMLQYIIPLFFVSLMILIPLRAKAEGGVYVSNSNFPDYNFRLYVQTNYCEKVNGKYYMSNDKIKEVTELSLIGTNGKEYKNLRGIEFFSELKTLKCTHNPGLTYLDLSSNKKLETLHCYNTGLSSLNTSYNTELKELQCQNCKISSLDLSKNTKLETLNCRNNLLKTLNISKNTELKELSCHQNNLETLDVTSNVNLERISCYNNKLKALNLSKNKKLTEVYCYSNSLTSLDVTGCSKLEILYCEDNALKSINLDGNPALKELYCQNNKLESLYTNNNNQVAIIYAYGNTSLKELKLDINGNLYKNIKSYKKAYQDDDTLTYTDNSNNVVIWIDKDATVVAIRSTVNNKEIDEESVKKFVSRMYYIMLERDAEADGLEYYTTRLVNKQMKACDVARSFIMSPELKGYNYSNEKYVTKMYLTFFDREPAQEEISYWVNKLQNEKKTREFVLSGFVNSPEFQKICDSYGIERGLFVVQQENENQNTSNNNNNNNNKAKVKVFVINTDNVKSDKLDAYIDRLYSVILGREADDDGRTYWRNQIIQGKQYDAVTAPRIGFFQSPEYMNRNVSDEQYIKDAYNAFLGRDPEPEGLEYWKNELKTGKNYNRQTMLDVGFGNSNEYKAILESYGFGVTEAWK